MKKLALMLLIALTSFALFSPALVHADSTLVITPTWTATEIDTDLWAMTTSFEIPAGGTILSILLPETEYASYVEIGGSTEYYSTVTFTDSVSDDIEFDLADLLSTIGQDEPYIQNWNIYNLDVDGDIYNLSSFDDIELVIMMTFESVPVGFEAYYNANDGFEWQISADLFKIVMFDGFTIYEEFYIPSAALAPPTRPADPEPLTGYDFVGWRTSSGEFYYFDALSPTNFDENGRFNLYASYQLTGDYGELPDEPTPDGLFESLLTAFGLFNAPGFMFVYVLLLMFITIPLIMLRVTIYVPIVIDILLTALFMFLGFLPILTSVVMFMLFTIGILMSIERASTYE